jgi:hypothetical protein
MNGLRARFWIEAALATASFAVMVVTLVWRDWIEAVFRVSPDGHDGSLEWMTVVAFAASTLIFAVLARWEFRQHHAEA